jgi:SAM-dependent methyltransferase
VIDSDLFFDITFLSLPLVGNIMISSSTEFWNTLYESHPAYRRNENDPILSSAIEYFGDLENKKILDLGCGDGSTSLFFAERGADVTAIDISSVAIDNLKDFIKGNNIENVSPITASAFDIADLGKFDFVFGSMILHHLEPFSEFSRLLASSIVPNGKAFFYENNAFSDILVWSRKNLVGKYGIPKHGDDDEFPLLPSEVNELRKYFNVQIDYPQLFFFRLASVYLFKDKLWGLTTGLDDFFFQFQNFRKLSYRQYLRLSQKI